MDYLTLFIVGFVAAITPGPDIFYILRQAICRGFGIAIFAILGVLLGNLIYLSLVALGFGAIGENLYFQLIIGVLGGLYLLRVSFLIFNEKPHLEKHCQNINKVQVLKGGFLMNITNPKAIIFFSAVITPFLTKNIIFSIVSLFLAISLGFFVAAFIASRFNIKDATLIVINKIASIVFFGFALMLFKSSYLALLKIV